jgi:hypothetical protein
MTGLSCCKGLMDMSFPRNPETNVYLRDRKRVFTPTPSGTIALKETKTIERRE